MYHLLLCVNKCEQNNEGYGPFSWMLKNIQITSEYGVIFRFYGCDEVKDFSSLRVRCIEYAHTLDHNRIKKNWALIKGVAVLSDCSPASFVVRLSPSFILIFPSPFFIHFLSNRIQ